VLWVVEPVIMVDLRVTVSENSTELVIAALINRVARAQDIVLPGVVGAAEEGGVTGAMDRVGTPVIPWAAGIS
jgi:hypothetical protein